MKMKALAIILSATFLSGLCSCGVESNKLHTDIFHFVKQDRLNEFTNTNVSELSALPISEWLQEKKIYALFDKERRG